MQTLKQELLNSKNQINLWHFSFFDWHIKQPITVDDAIWEDPKNLEPRNQYWRTYNKTLRPFLTFKEPYCNSKIL